MRALHTITARPRRGSSGVFLNQGCVAITLRTHFVYGREDMIKEIIERTPEQATIAIICMPCLGPASLSSWARGAHCSAESRRQLLEDYDLVVPAGQFLRPAPLRVGDIGGQIRAACGPTHRCYEPPAQVERKLQKAAAAAEPLPRCHSCDLELPPNGSSSSEKTRTRLAGLHGCPEYPAGPAVWFCRRCNGRIRGKRRRKAKAEQAGLPLLKPGQRRTR